MNAGKSRRNSAENPEQRARPLVNISRKVRSALHEDSRLLVGSAAFAVIAVVVYRLVVSFGVAP
jgi:hypothetical protein